MNEILYYKLLHGCARSKPTWALWACRGATTAQQFSCLIHVWANLQKHPVVADFISHPQATKDDLAVAPWQAPGGSLTVPLREEEAQLHLQQLAGCGALEGSYVGSKKEGVAAYVDWIALQAFVTFRHEQRGCIPVCPFGSFAEGKVLALHCLCCSMSLGSLMQKGPCAAFSAS